MEYLPEDVCFVIYEYLNIKEIYNLKSVELFTASSIKYLDEIILKKLRNIFKTNYSSIIKFLADTDSYIGGSLILICLYDTKWKSDIDIYVNRKYVSFVNELISNLQMVKSEREKKDYHETLGGKYIFDVINCKYKYELSRFIRDRDVVGPIHYSNDAYETSRSYQTIKDKDTGKSSTVLGYTINYNYDIQFIIVDDPKTFMTETFDLDICLNYFNGRDLFLYNPDNIINKKMSILRDMKCERVRKYLNRGFLLEVNKNNLEYLKYEINNIFDNDTDNLIKNKYQVYTNGINLEDYNILDSCEHLCLTKKLFGNINHRHIVNKKDHPLMDFSSVIIL